MNNQKSAEKAQSKNNAATEAVAEKSAPRVETRGRKAKEISKEEISKEFGDLFMKVIEYREQVKRNDNNESVFAKRIWMRLHQINKQVFKS